jgi:hypothetical protein
MYNKAFWYDCLLVCINKTSEVFLLREKEHGHGGTMSAFTFLKQNYADDY